MNATRHPQNLILAFVPIFGQVMSTVYPGCRSLLILTQRHVLEAFHLFPNLRIALQISRHLFLNLRGNARKEKFLKNCAITKKIL